ncbi:MAG: hypothetical protein IJ882_00820 [Paludibacteraceae bacterium]|nr:hypothetical protein [Paludibacteraceae bacterium]
MMDRVRRDPLAVTPADLAHVSVAPKDDAAQMLPFARLIKRVRALHSP